MIPQVHVPGRTAEVDFGDVWVIVSGEKLRAKMFAMRLSSSAKTFHQVYMGESQECFLDGHEKAFGGIPARGLMARANKATSPPRLPRYSLKCRLVMHLCQSLHAWDTW
jgi:hypothetical protein